MMVNKGSEKAGLKLNIQKTKIMAFRPITSWQIVREILKVVTDFIFLDPKITVGSDYSHETKRCLLLRQCIEKQTPLCQQRSVYLFSSSCV